MLVQARGDWAWYKQLFSFPSWASHSICWKCGANTGDMDYTQFGVKAAWRRHRYTAREFFIRQREHGIAPSPLFKCPNFTLDMVTIDVRHCMDLGVAQDTLGSLFWLSCQTHFPGRAFKDRVGALWETLRTYYRNHTTANQLQALTPEMIKRGGKAPKLRAKGAETRGLVPFGFVLATLMHEADPSSYNEAVVKLLARLLDLYMITPCGEWHAEVASKSCREFLLLYAVLQRQAEFEGIWVVKPKFHLMQELFEFQGPYIGNPRFFWCYRDESFVGLIGTIAHPRGDARACNDPCRNLAEVPAVG